MADLKRQKAFFKTKANFVTKLASGEITEDMICYILDTKEVWTHNAYFGMSKELADQLATLSATVETLDGLVMFSRLSDGTNTVESPSKTGVITVKGGGKTTVSVGADGITVNTPKATVAAGTAAGQVKVDGQDVKVTGWDTLGTAAFTDSTAYATAAQGTKADNAVPKTTTVNGHALTGNVTVSKADVGLGNVTNESKATMFASPVFTGNPTAPTPAATDNDTSVATTAFVQAAIDAKLAAGDAMIYKGTLGTGGTVTALPDTTAKTGWTYKVITAGTYAGQKCEVGDMVVALTDGSTATAATWTVIQANIDGAVTGPASSVDAHVATFSGATGKVIKDSGFTIGTSVPAGAKFTDTTYTAMGGATASAAGKAGLVPAPAAGKQGSYLKGDGTWGDPADTKYTFAAGTDGSFSVTPTGGTAQKVAVGKPATAGTADKVAAVMKIQLNGGTTEGTNMFTFDGSAAKTVSITAAKIGAAAASHNQPSSTINAMTGYVKPSAVTPILPADTLNAAIGKLEAALEWAEYD